ncbi:poly [ADP-ribose] polymerase 2-like isoform X2 [Asterias rubens]|nr:poly [ADP-ribose] polymerase 2-like isoform X2 [Asterias rubens]XP_033626575.1 poly [ADP-ribose] polymerase 2-like isoform X2 [Asterias rubens]
MATNMELGWEFEGDRRQWMAFSEENNNSINETHNDTSKSSVKLTVNSVLLEIKLDKMVQRNCTTGWERRIRCAVKDDSGDYFVWQWQDEKNRWNPYSVEHSVLLEAAKQYSEDSVDIVAAHRAYKIDLQSMEQSNVTTQVIRKVERHKIDYEVPPPQPAAKSQPAKRTKSQPAKRTRTKATTKSNGVKTEPMEEEEEVEVKPAKSAKKTKSQGPSGGPDIKTVRIASGHKAPVDSECHAMADKAHVYIEGNEVYDAMLNQTNLMNNNNKYYIIQLLEENAKKIYYVWFRWGRVGKVGQNSLVPCGHDLLEAKSVFEKKYWDKTRNEWSLKNSFEKVPGKYDMLKMDYTVDTKAKDEPDAGKVKKEKVASKLDKKVQDLIQLICNIQAMEDMVVEMKYDAQKAPLGKLTQDQIKAGYSALKKIEQCINKNTVGEKLIKACDEFYTRIPHNFGMRRPPVIRSKDELRAKIALLEALGDIQVAMTILKENRNVDEHPIDSQYHSLKCTMKSLEKTHPDFKMIQQYVQNTHAKTHNQFKMQVSDVFEIDKEGEAENFNDVGNNMLLWHGSRLTNWAGILGQGLRIAPPEAPVTGYMFGKGVYFADMSSKSANYCFATRSKNTGLLLLSQVGLGTANTLLAADYKADKLPAGKHSVKGLGKIAPNPASDFTMPDGTVVPLGKGTDTGVDNPNGYTLNYNEFIVYNTNQIRMRYLVWVKFNFN